MTALSGKKAIVTGGAMGIGLSTCKRLVREGCDVTIWDLSQKDMENAVKELRAMFPIKTVSMNLPSRQEKIWERWIF